MVEYIIGFYCTLSFVWVTINRNKLSRHASMSVKQQICKNALTLTLNWTCCKNSIFLPSSSIERRAQYTSILLCHTSVTD